MISIQMPSNMTETSREYERTLCFSNSDDLQEPFLERQKRSAPPPPPRDTNNISGFEKLLSLEGVHIEKNYSWGKVPCCGTSCPTVVDKYSYKISDLGAFGSEEKDQSGDQVLRGTENIPDFDNIWCTTGHRAFDIEVQHQEFNWRLPNASFFLKLERKFKWSFLCMNRPEMIVTLVEGGKTERLGRIVNPIQCGVDFRVKIYDAAESLRYVIKADCCSCGVTCPGSCSTETIMTVYDGFGNVEGKLTILEGKRVPDGVRHSFSMNFPENSSGSDRALLIAGVLMIGKTFFETNDIVTNFCEALSETQK